MNIAPITREATAANPPQDKIPSASPVAPPSALSKSAASKPINWIGTMLPALFVFAALGALAYWGHKNGWKIPKSSELRGESASKKDDWCAEHNVPESICVECNPDLMPRSKAPCLLRK